MKTDFIDFEVSGEQALFTDPITKIGGEKCSYHIPTYEAIKGMSKSIYWKPSITLIVDKVRVMNQIRTESEGIKVPKFNSNSNDLATYTYLSKVKYQVRIRIEPNHFRPEFSSDWNLVKHYEIMARCLERGTRRDVYFGTSECQATTVDPCNFGDGKGQYDDLPELGFGQMFHGFDYPDETGINKLQSRFWKPTMRYGVIEFIRPEKCTIRKFICAMKPRVFETKTKE